MVATPPPRPLAWRRAPVVATRDEMPRVRTLALDVPGWPGHLPGQHRDARFHLRFGLGTRYGSAALVH